jgi:flagellar biosynthesis regulator FlaF
MSDRAELERRVDELAERHSGQAFADAVRELHAGLGQRERGILEEILVERAAAAGDAVMRRIDARGWLRRQWDRASGRR